jgi:hypothetical protein
MEGVRLCTLLRDDDDGYARDGEAEEAIEDEDEAEDEEYSTP